MIADERDDPPAPAASAEAPERHATLTVGIIVERRAAKSAWQDHVWQPVEAVTVLPPLAPWAVLREDGGVTRFYAGPFVLDLHPRETISYQANLETGKPAIYVVLRPDGAAPYGMRLELATLSPGQAEAYMESGLEVVDKVPMPDDVVAWLDAYMAAYHVDESFKKRRRGRDKPAARKLT